MAEEIGPLLCLPLINCGILDMTVNALLPAFQLSVLSKGYVNFLVITLIISAIHMLQYACVTLPKK